MSHPTHTIVPLDDAPKIAPKTRACLRCQSTFESEWAGQRICGRCKGTAAWRTGASMHSSSGGRSR